MKLLIVDSDTCGLDLALRAQTFDHEVKLFSGKENGERLRCGDGLVPKVSSWEPHAKWADLIVATHNSKYITALDAMRDEGLPIFAPPKEGRRLEVERGFGMQVLKKFGIETPTYKTFQSFDEAEAFLWKSSERWVFKTLGDESDKSLSYCAQSPADLIQRIRTWKKEGRKLKGPCMLQQFVEGCEFGVSAFFGPGGFNSYYSECFEHKKLCAGNVGPNTGEMGSCLKWVKKSKLGNELLNPIIPFLRKIGYVGDCAVNAIIDEKGTPWPLEFTCRLGYPAFWIMLAQNKGDPIQWMKDLVDGKDTQNVVDQIGTGIVLDQSNVKNKVEGHPIYGVTDKNAEQIHFVDVMAGRGIDMVKGKSAEKDMLIASGDYLACVTGLGDTVRASARSAYKVVDDLHVSNMIYRDDIGEHLKEDIPTLQAHGFAVDWEY